eukprot:1160269-Pelagomonas_calceolata.AAC.7
MARQQLWLGRELLACKYPWLACVHGSSINPYLNSSWTLIASFGCRGGQPGWLRVCSGPAMPRVRCFSRGRRIWSTLRFKLKEPP